MTLFAVEKHKVYNNFCIIIFLLNRHTFCNGRNFYQLLRSSDTHDGENLTRYNVTVVLCVLCHRDINLKCVMCMYYHFHDLSRWE